MRVNFRLFAAALVLVFASSAAHAFVLEAKGPAAKWRTDFTKRNNKYTTCLLTAWNKAEIAAAKAELAQENGQMIIDGYGKNGALCTAVNVPQPLCTGAGTMNQNTYRNAIGLGSLPDVDLAADPVVAAGGSSINPADVTVINDTITLKCNPIMALADDLADPAKPKGKGLNSANPIAVNGGFTLSDVGCLGDCSTAQGVQACANTNTLKTEIVKPQNNARNTAVSIGSLIPFAIATAVPNCGTPWPDTSGAGINLGTTATLKYIEKVGACVQKCQDDFVTDPAKSKGNGFKNDTINCILNGGGTGALQPLGTGAGFNTCVNNAYLATLGDPDLALDPGWSCLTNFLVNAPPFGAGLGPITALIAGQTSLATNSAYDRGDLEAGFIAGVLGVALPSQAPSMGGRAASDTRHAYGNCASFGNSVIEDYEECEPFITTLCPSIPGTVASFGGDAACLSAKVPFFCCTGPGTGTCSSCPAADNAASKLAAGRCQRP